MCNAASYLIRNSRRLDKRMTTETTGAVSAAVSGQDTLQKFIFDNAAVRGQFIDVSHTWQEVVSRHAYPTAVKKVLGEMVAAAALLSANLKFNGSIIMQIHGDGPVRLMVVECDSDLRLRATAKLDPDATIADVASVPQLLNATGKGRFIITLDPADKVPGQQPYQGIVPLDGDDMATVIENYMLRSEQLDTRLWLATDDSVSRGLLLQKLPHHGGKAEATPVSEDAALVLGRNDPRLRPAAPELPLQLHARKSGQYAQDAGRGRSQRHPGRSRESGRELRFLRPALRIRQGRLRATVHHGCAGRSTDSASRQHQLSSSKHYSFA